LGTGKSLSIALRWTGFPLADAMLGFSNLALRESQSKHTGHSTPPAGGKGWTVVQPEQMKAFDLSPIHPP